MKKYIMIVAVIFTTSCFGQGTIADTTKKEYKNIIALDATALLKQFFNFNPNYYPSSNSTYMITYRRVLKNNAIKVGIGGYGYTSSTTYNDSLKNNRTFNNFTVGLGFEHYNYLGKRWTFYYGIDAIAGYSENKSKDPRSTTSYYESTSKSNSYGLSPLLGIVFRITDRMSVSTESSYNISYSTSTYKSTEIPNTQYNSKNATTGISSTFIAPTEITFRFKF